jgi:mannose-1-phosphate guanylyltransferase
MELTLNDSEYGWILPATGDPVASVRHFEEKPPIKRLRQLASCGALINSFIIVTRAQLMVELFEETLPEALRSFRECASHSSATPSLPHVYEGLARADFSRDVLERATRFLKVVRSAPCGWSDLGTPARLQRFLAQTQPASPLSIRSGHDRRAEEACSLGWT